MRNTRPKFLDLRQIRLPVPAWVSILHRVTGVLLFLALPLLLWTLQYSLLSPETFAMLKWMLSHLVSKIFLVLILWAFLHHFFAGIRYLLLDLGYGLDIAQARTSSKLVLAFSLALTIILGVQLW